jgi:dihydroorotate dehydrogenase electron transfer subunit
MRRPLSIMRADPAKGTIEFLYKIVGHGLAQLATRKRGECISILGPIGQPFRPDAKRPKSVLVGGGVGIPPMIFLAESMAADAGSGWEPLVLMGSEIPFPFGLASSGTFCHLPDPATAALEDLEALGVPSRLASGAEIPGCFPGFVTQLAETWLSGLTGVELDQTAIFACGPTPMLAETARVAAVFGVPCQVSLEEFMACAVGGCAGCTVPIRTPSGVAMKRVCVDGPVFDAVAVFPPAA